MIETVGEMYTPAHKLLLKMWHVHVPPGKRPFQRHFHTRFEIMLVQSGGGVYMTDSGAHPMAANDMFVFAGNEFHSISDVSSEGLVITNLHFEPSFLLEKSDTAMRNTYFNLCYTHSKEFCNRIAAAESIPLRALFHSIEQELLHPQAAQSLAVSAYLQLFMTQLIRQHCYAADSAAQTQVQGLAQVLQYIDAHFAEPLTLEQLAGQLGITPTYFSALFRQAFSVSPWDYLLTKRIEHAIHLLLTDQKQ
ncbi:MAG: helix-turn-helix transcriptional regulator, partial [Clostridia bacterium]|nr:helix-turn-helix transcriptional regulator [Clostridia bacterium]